MKLSTNFTLSELIESETARKLNITEQFNPPEYIINNLTQFCHRVLQPLRDRLNRPIQISSGYRCPKLNKAVGGVADSAHTSGMAADIDYNTQAEAIQIVEALIAIGVKRIGLHKSFIHADTDPNKPSPAIWNYGKGTPKWLLDKRTEWLKRM